MKHSIRTFMFANRLVHSLSRVLVLFSLLFFVGASTAWADEVIRVTGKVTFKGKTEPLWGVNVVDGATKRLVAKTDEDGRFAVNVHANGRLTFSMVGAEPTTIKIQGRTYIEVELEAIDVALGEAVVGISRVKDEVRVENTTITVKGNYMYIPIRVRLPRDMFRQDRRLVVQPFLKNLTKKQIVAMKPLVYDAQNYHATQNRMYEFDMDKEGHDPLAKYVIVKQDSLRDKGTKQDIFGHTDSIYCEDARDAFTCEVHMAMENYRKIVYRDTSVVAKGTINPLRWLDYSFTPMQLTDTAYYPKAEKQLRDSKGEINLQFVVGKAVLEDTPQNAEELAKLRSSINSVVSDKDASLQSLTIAGTASPDGNYDLNLKLARERMAYAMNFMREQLPQEARANAKFTSNASVASWEDVVTLLRRDTLNDEADQVEDVLKRNRPRTLGQAMKKLPFYQTLLLTKYLPQLRRVDYNMNYSIFRQLTLDEIKQLYNKDYRQLSRYEFFRLYRQEADDSLRVKYCRQALEMYPSFMIAANDLQGDLIKGKKSEPELLQKFVGKKAPVEVNVNHIIACLAHGQYTAVDSLLDYIPVNEETRMLKAVAAAYNGDYKNSYETIAATGTQNKIAMLLAMKRNEEAYKACNELSDSLAVTHYLKAVCLNRMDNAVDGLVELLQAFRMDPALKDIARQDGDVNTMMEEEDLAE